MVEVKKLAAAKKALEYIEDNSIIGIGTGSTVKYFIRLLGDALKSGHVKNVRGVPSSYDTRLLMLEANIPIVDLIEYDYLDVAVDGADSVLVKKKILIKGGGGAFLREKILAYSSKRVIIIVDDSKIDRVFPIPVEILPFSISVVKRKIRELHGELRLRPCNGKVGPCISDNGNIIGDAYFSNDQITPSLEVKLNSIPGILENGLFNVKCKIIIGKNKDITEEMVF